VEELSSRREEPPAWPEERLFWAEERLAKTEERTWLRAERHSNWQPQWTDAGKIIP
jgi:hypothetical protein